MRRGGERSLCGQGFKKVMERRKEASKRKKRKQLLDVKAMTRTPTVTEKSNLSAIRRISGGQIALAFWTIGVLRLRKGEKDPQQLLQMIE